MGSLILIVEDEPELSRLLSNIVQRQGYRVIEALSGRAALDVLERESPDCILLDLAMPGVTGLEVLRVLRGSPQHRHTRIVVVTARPQMVPEAELYGVDRVMIKPVGVHELIAAVEEMLG
ncbi:MAG: response regulator [Anaerolineae bacterium]|nr:response regulator [Anaerolineae bacterium]